MKSKLWVMLACMTIGLSGLGLTYWDRGDDIKFTIATDTLGGANVAASTLDSTACFPWAAKFGIVVGPGYGDTSFFARGRVNTGYGDSIMLRFYLRGWSTKNRNHLMSVTPLWGYAAPFIQYTRPKANLWSSITNGQADSTTRIIITERNAFHISGGVTTYDSTGYYYQDARTTKYILVPFAPYYDVIMADSAAVTGKACFAKVTVLGFNE